MVIETTSTSPLELIVGVAEAAEMLGYMGAAGEFALPALTLATSSTDPVVRMLASRSLGQIGIASDEVRAALKRRQADTDGDVREAASAAIKKLDGQTKK